MFPVNLLTTSCSSILLHGVISLPDTTSYDNLLKLHFYLFICVTSFICVLFFKFLQYRI